MRMAALDDLVQNAILNDDRDVKGTARFVIKSAAQQLGIVPASIQGLYEARGAGKNHGYTVPALNIRGMSYDLSKAIFRTAQSTDCGAFIFEIAKSEIGYTHQRPHELVSVILAAAIKEKFRGPVFIQGDHFQINAKKFHEDRTKEVEGLKDLIREGLNAGFISACLSSFRRPAPDTAPTKAKASCLYPMTGFAMQEAKKKGFDNAVMLDHEYNVAEFATANLWIVKDGVASTPVWNGAFLNGVTRQRVMALLRDAGVEVAERTLTMDEVRDADEIFSTGNFAKVKPVSRIEDRELQPGPIFRQARELYFAFARDSRFRISA